MRTAAQPPVPGFFRHASSVKIVTRCVTFKKEKTCLLKYWSTDDFIQSVADHSCIYNQRAFQRRFNSASRGSFKRAGFAFPNLSSTSSLAGGQSPAFSGNTVHNNSSVFSECSFNRLSSTSKLFSPKYSASISVKGNILSTFSGKFVASEKAKSQSLALVCGLLAIFCFGHTWFRNRGSCLAQLVSLSSFAEDNLSSCDSVSS
jgi:hypothetical protein